MDENKKIEKLSETGEQSTEKIVGGANNHEMDLEKFNLPMFKPLEPRYGGDVMGHCKDCGATTTNNAYGGYCYRCWHRRKRGEKPKSPSNAHLDDRSLSDSDLLQVSGGSITVDSPALKDLVDKIKYVDHEYKCRACGKTFIRRDPTGNALAMAPRPIEEEVYCDECLSKIHSSRRK